MEAGAALQQSHLHDPFFPLYVVFTEDRADILLYGVLMIPVGMLLWRFTRRSLSWFGIIIAAVFLVEFLQMVLGLYYFRLYVILACAIGLALGAGFDVICCQTQKRRTIRWTMLGICVFAAICAEQLTRWGYSIYELATLPLREGQNVYSVLLITAVLLGKAICLGALAAPLLPPGKAAGLCAIVLLLASPTVLWKSLAAGQIWGPAVYLLAASGSAMVLCLWVFGQRPSTASKSLCTQER